METKELTALLNAFQTRTETITLDQILPPKVALRVHEDDADNIQALAKDLETNGLDNPVCVLENGDGTFILNDGSRRWTATGVLADESRNIAGLSVNEITVKVIGLASEWTEEAELANQMRLNTQSLETSPKEYYNACIKLASAGWTVRDIAESINQPQTKVGLWLRSLALPNEIRERVISGEITLANGKTLADNKKHFDMDTLSILADSAAEMTASDFSDKIEETIKKQKESGDNSGETGTKEKVFELTPIFPSRKALEENYSVAMDQFNENPNPTTEATLNFYKELFQVDASSEARRKAEFDKKAEEAKANAEKRKKERVLKSLGTTAADFIKENGQEAFDALIAEAKEASTEA